MIAFSSNYCFTFDLIEGFRKSYNSADAYFSTSIVTLIRYATAAVVLAFSIGIHVFFLYVLYFELNFDISLKTMFFNV